MHARCSTRRAFKTLRARHVTLPTFAELNLRKPHRQIYIRLRAELHAETGLITYLDVLESEEKLMERKQEQQQQQCRRQEEEKEDEEKNIGQSREDKKNKGSSEEGLPIESSPYVNYDDLEDYKRKGYGTEGHLEPKPGRGAGATDAPTPSGGAVSSHADIVSATDTISQQGVP